MKTMFDERYYVVLEIDCFSFYSAHEDSVWWRCYVVLEIDCFHFTARTKTMFDDDM